MESNPSLILSEEHDLIRKMITILDNSLDHLKEVQKKGFFDVVIDFFHTFADKGHHGKEEFIFFKKLEKKNLSAAERKLLFELIEEHKLGRALINELEQKKDKDIASIKEILKKIIKLYTNHIQKENIHFFPPAFEYFSEGEKKNMLPEFYESDKTVFFLKYKNIVEILSGGK